MTPWQNILHNRSALRHKADIKLGGSPRTTQFNKKKGLRSADKHEKVRRHGWRRTIPLISKIYVLVINLTRWQNLIHCSRSDELKMHEFFSRVFGPNPNGTCPFIFTGCTMRRFVCLWPNKNRRTRDDTECKWPGGEVFQ